MNILTIIKKEWGAMDFYPLISFSAIIFAILWSIYFGFTRYIPSMTEEVSTYAELIGNYKDFLFFLKIKTLMLSLAMSGILIIAFNYVNYIVISMVKKLSLHKSTLDKFISYSAYSYLIVLFGFLSFFGFLLNLAFISLLVVLWILTQIILFFTICDSKQRVQVISSAEFLAGLFMLSGFAALIYQIAWQRILFSVFGVNIESVTVIVSVFMFGLGIGSLAGGWLSNIFKNRLVALFMTLEILIGIFGFFSINIIEFINTIAGTTNVWQLSLYVYLILAIPTLLMGATLPILVTYLHKYYKNIGRSIGILYAFNTLGSAIAAFLTVSLIFVIGGLSNAIQIAVLANFTTAFLIYLFAKNIDKKITFSTVNLHGSRPVVSP